MAQISFERPFIVIVAQVSMWPHGPLVTQSCINANSSVTGVKGRSLTVRVTKKNIHKYHQCHLC